MATVVEVTLKGLDEVSPAFRSIGSTASAVAKDLSSGFENAGKSIKEAGTSLTTLTAPLALAGGAAIKFSNELNSAMGDVATLLPEGTAHVVDLKKAVQQLAIDVGKNTKDIAGGLYQVISAFGDGPESMDKLGVAARAATAGVATTTDAINLLSGVTKGYGDTSLAAVKTTSDLAFTTVKLGQTTFPELAGSMGAVTPLAASLGVENTELFGTFATLTGVTGGASEVATQFRGVLQALMAPTKDMSTLVSDMGFSSSQAMLQQLGLKGTIDAVVRAAESTGAPLQNYIGSIEGQTAAMALAGPQADTFKQKLDAMGEAAGAADAAFAAKTTGINAAGFAWTQFQQKLAVTAQQLGDQLAPAFAQAMTAAQPLIDAVQRAVTWFANLDAGTQTTILTIAAVVVAAGPVLMIIGSVVSAIGTLIPVIQGLGTALIFLTTNPIGITITAIAALVAAGIWLYTHWDEVRAFAVSIWTAIAGFFTGIWSAITGAVQGAWNAIASFFTTIWTTITTGIQTAWNAIVAWFREWWGTILLGVFTGGIGLIVALIAGNWDTIMAGTIAVWNAIVEFFTNLWPNLKQLAVDGLLALATWLTEKGLEIKQGFIDVWNGVVEFFTNLWPNLKQLAMDGMNALGSWLVEKATSIRQSFVDMWEGMITFLTSLPARMVEAGANIIKGLVKGIASIKIPVPDIGLDWKEGPLGIKIPSLRIGVNWRTLGDLIPWLADGGIADHAMIAGIGEAGKEAVLPLDQIVPLMSQAMAQAGGAPGGGGDKIIIDMRGSTFRDGRDAGNQIIRSLVRRGYRIGEA